MKLLSLRVFQFRNLEDQRIDLSPGTNLLTGLNGQGKTNFLEAIFLLGYGRSFRTALPREFIRHGEVECCVEGVVDLGSVTRQLQVFVGSEGKKLFLRGKPAGLEEFAGSFHVLAFAHEHMKVIRGGPGERRSFLDRAMITLYPGHLRHLAAYGRALKQRNRLLSEARAAGVCANEVMLDSWDQTLVTEGARILWNRSRYVSEIREKLPLDLFDAESFRISYHSTVGEEGQNLDEIEAAFRSKLAKSRAVDRRLGITSTGPHRDDLRLFLDEKPVGDFGSAGQQRSCLLSLYFAQMEIHRNKHGFYPVFLIDDFEAELDDRRLKTFLTYLAERAQICLTTAKTGSLGLFAAEVRRFEIRSGRAFVCD